MLKENLGRLVNQSQSLEWHASVRVYLRKRTPRYYIHEFRRQVEPGTSSSRIGIKFDAPVSKNIGCIPMTMPYKSGRKRSESGRASTKLATNFFT